MQGILMKPDMIQAAVEGRKTNTRRAEAGLREINQNPDDWEAPIKVVNNAYPAKVGDWLFQHNTQLTLCVIARPRYHIGETVYIKEAYKRWCPDGAWNVRYKDGSIKRTDVAGDPQMDDEFLVEPIKWQSPLFMPEWAARHFIFVEAVRPERLQEITGADCLAEGIEPCKYKGYTDSYKNNDYLVGHFATLWNSINPKYPWESNPWVWVYNFSLAKARR